MDPNVYDIFVEVMFLYMSLTVSITFYGDINVTVVKYLLMFIDEEMHLSLSGSNVLFYS